MNKQIEALQAALEQQRKYEAEIWPFVDEQNKPTGTGESITYHLASLYQWSPDFVLTLPPEKRDERLNEIWRSFALAGDIIKRYEDAVVALLQDQTDSSELERLKAIEQRVEPPATRQWKRLRGSLLQCLEKAASIYAYTTQEDQGNIDWRVQTWRLKQRDKDTFTPAELLERIRRDSEQAALPAVLDYDTAWFGETVYPDDGPVEGLWVHARLYIVGIDQTPAAIIYRIDFEEEGKYV